MKTKIKFTIGADPELFWKQPNPEKLISIVGLLGGTKESPLPIGEGCAVQEDNVAAEFCIPPCVSAQEFIKSINFSLEEIDAKAKAVGLTLAKEIASASFDPDQLTTYEAQRFGCDPDYNAYTGRVNPRPKCDDPNLRSAGGHVHVGTKQDALTVIKSMDLFLGVPSLLIDKDEKRRLLYGKAGCFRYKPYGVEYRTLSNFWIWKNETIDWVYHQVQKALEFCAEDFDKKIPVELQKVIRGCINHNDKNTAKELMNEWGIQTP